METWFIGYSKIHGIGVLANTTIPANSFIDVAIESNQKITFFGSKINHSWKPSAIMVFDTNRKTYGIFAINDIRQNEEITLNYEDTPPFIAKPNPKWK
jgi:SET domain-containing protein